MADPLIPGGYVMIARQIRNSSLWRSMKATHREVMLEILLQAQWQDVDVIRDGEIIPLRRGQLATSYNQLVDDIGDKEITIKVVRNAIAKMLKADFLTKDEEKARAKKGLLLTVVKWEFFQNPDNYKRLSENEVRIDHCESKSAFLGNESGKVENPENPDTVGVLFSELAEEGKAKGNTRAKQGQSKGKARAINNKSNKSNNVDNTITPIVPLKKTRAEMFETFWKAYPKRVARGQAEKTWDKLKNINEQFLEVILDGIERSKKSKAWLKQDGQFIPNPSTWLNAKGWMDEHEKERGDPDNGQPGSHSAEGVYFSPSEDPYPRPPGG